MNQEEAKEELLGVDEKCVLQYLRNYPADFVTEMEVTRHADGRSRYLQDKHWAHIAFMQLLEAGLVDSDGSGRYRIHSSAPEKTGSKIKFLAPQIRDILEHNGHHLDLSGFA